MFLTRGDNVYLLKSGPFCLSCVFAFHVFQYAYRACRYPFVYVEPALARNPQSSVKMIFILIYVTPFQPIS